MSATPESNSTRQEPSIAEKLHQLRYIYSIYGFLDGLSTALVFEKYWFDLFPSWDGLSSAEAMHDWMITPTGALTTATSTVTLAVFSMLANHFDTGDSNRYKRFMATIWPYLRDAIKAPKNVYTALRSTFQLAELGGQDLHSLIIPTSLLLGALSALNRIWYRHMKEQRKEMMKANAKLFSEIKKATSSSANFIEWESRIGKQSSLLKGAGLLSAAFGGIVEALYLYVGVLSLCSLAPPLLITMAVFTTIFCLAYVATRIYEEYDFQRKLIITQTNIELALYAKKIQFLMDHLDSLDIALLGDPANQSLSNKLAEPTKQFSMTMSLLLNKRQELCDRSTLSSFSVLLEGMKNGLAAYGVITSALLAFATTLVLFSTTVSPLILINCISLGMVCLLGFAYYSLNSYVPPKQEIKDATQLVGDKLKPDEIKTKIMDVLAIDDPSPQFYFQEWFEVARSTCSGARQGCKVIRSLRNLFPWTNEEASYIETAIMLPFIVLSSFAYAGALGLRAYARSFGRPSIGISTAATKDSSWLDTPGEVRDSAPQKKEEKPSLHQELEKSNEVHQQRDASNVMVLSTPKPLREENILPPSVGRSGHAFFGQTPPISSKTCREEYRKEFTLSLFDGRGFNAMGLVGS